MEAERYIIEKFNLDINQKMPIKIKSSGRWYALPQTFNELGYKVGAEIGVEQGVYSARLCKKIPGLRLYCIDPWKAYKGYRDHVSQSKLDMFYENTKKKLAEYNCEIIRKFSMDAVLEFEDNSLDFVYIDGNHDFKNVANDIVEWEKKVRVGGIVSGHDFRRQRTGSKYICHVKDVVHAYTYSHGIRPWFVTAERSPSWFYVKG